MMALLYRCRMGSDKMAFFLKRRDGAVEKKEQEAEGVGKHDATTSLIDPWACTALQIRTLRRRGSDNFKFPMR